MGFYDLKLRNEIMRVNMFSIMLGYTDTTALLRILYLVRTGYGYALDTP
jgi:hypothetical protein